MSRQMGRHFNERTYSMGNFDSVQRGHRDAQQDTDGLAGLVTRVAAGLIGLLLVWGSFGFMGTGMYGVRSTLSQMSADEVPAGLYFKWPLVSDVLPVTGKEVEVPLINLTPKAGDNLSMKDLDVSVYYTTAPTQIADLLIKYSGQTSYQEVTTTNGEAVVPTDVLAPAYLLVRNIAKEAVYKAAGATPSLTMHQERDKLAEAIRAEAQVALNSRDPGTFTITRVVIRQALTDPSIEQSIQAAVSSQKKLEAMAVQVQIAQREAEIEVTRANGIAQAQRIIAGTLTPEYLAHERNEALKRAADKGTLSTWMVPEGTHPLVSMSK